MFKCNDFFSVQNKVIKVFPEVSIVVEANGMLYIIIIYIYYYILINH